MPRTELCSGAGVACPSPAGSTKAYLQRNLPRSGGPPIVKLLAYYGASKKRSPVPSFALVRGGSRGEFSPARASGLVFCSATGGAIIQGFVPSDAKAPTDAKALVGRLAGMQNEF